MNRRTRVVAAAVACASAVVLLSFWGSLHFSGLRAREVEQLRLQRVADIAMTRASKSFDEIDAALQSVATLTMRPCSDEHIALMRQSTLESRGVAEIDYFEDGKLKCSSWGMPEQGRDIVLGKPEFTTRDGVDVHTHAPPAAGKGKPMLGLFKNRHRVLVDPAGLADIVADPDVQVAVATSGGALLGSQNAPDAELVGKLVRDRGNHPAIAGADRMQAAVARKGELAAVGLAPESSMRRQLRNEQLYILPFGFLLAAVAISLLVWLTRSRLSLLGEMAQALKNREFIVHYQPLVRLKDGVCVGAEALIRWPRPDGSMMRPDYFIPQAEESGLIEAMTDQLVETVVREMRALLLAQRHLHIAINVCASDIQTGRLLDVLARALDGSGIEPGQIWLEATERGFIDVAAARQALERARAMGFSVAIDDFGTGYSSLAYLQNLPIDALKIDKSFIDTIGGDTVTSSVTSHIIAMAQTLQLAIIAEGIETPLQADYLRARDVEYGQGWLFSRALPPADFIAYCHRHREEGQDGSRAAA